MNHLRVVTQQCHRIAFVGRSAKAVVNDQLVAVVVFLAEHDVHVLLAKCIDRNVDRYYGNLILSTAPISIGNSGGPLFNLKGQVIGINTIVSASNAGGAQLAFAIPVHEWTRSIIEQIRVGKKIEYGYVGISLGNPTGKSGAIVVDILKDTPAGKAGIQQNDLILECNKQKIKNSDHLIMLIGQTIPGKKIVLRVARGEKTFDVEVTAAKRSDFIQDATGSYGKLDVKKHE
jgi:S1-C subfamily serine protease